MDNVALDRLYQMAREWERGVEYRDDDGGLDDWAEGKVAGYNSCARDLLAFVKHQRDVEADKARQGEQHDAHTAGGR